MIFILVSMLWYRLSVCCVIIVLATGCQTPLREVKLKWLSWADDNNLMTDTHALVSDALTKARTDMFMHKSTHWPNLRWAAQTNEHVLMHARLYKWMHCGKFTFWQEPIPWIIEELVYIKHLLSHKWIRNTFVCAGNHHVIIKAQCHIQIQLGVKSVPILIPFSLIRSKHLLVTLLLFCVVWDFELFNQKQKKQKM